jgi:hypothetical protein
MLFIFHIKKTKPGFQLTSTRRKQMPENDICLRIEGEFVNVPFWPHRQERRTARQEAEIRVEN